MSTPTPSVSSVIRSILMTDPEMPADEVIKRALARGVKSSPGAIRHSVHNHRGAVRKLVQSGGKPAAPAPKPAAPAAKSAPVPVAAKSGPVPVAGKSAPIPVAGKSAPIPVPAAEPAAAPDVAGVLANVALVDKVAGTAGGVDNARQVAEAVRACGGVDAFLQHLALVAGIKTA